MHPDKNMQKVIQGKRYSVATSQLIASDEYWDGNNFERSGRNTFLYRTRGGAYYQVNLTQWQGERETLQLLTRPEAIELYESLPEHQVEYDAAFDAVIEEATAGRPTYFGEPMPQTAIWLPEEMIAWLKSQPNTMSDVIRELIQKAMIN